MDLSSLMIILGSHRFTFLHTRMKHYIHSLSIARKFKMKKASLLLMLEVTMKVNLKIMVLNRFIMHMVMAIKWGC